MRSNSTLRRLAFAATLVLHVLVVGLVPLADARLEVASLGEIAHIEPLGDGPCDPSHHDHMECQLCRTVGWGAALFLDRAELQSAPGSEMLGSIRSPAPLRAIRGGPLGPRAPPAV